VLSRPRTAPARSLSDDQPPAGTIPLRPRARIAGAPFGQTRGSSRGGVADPLTSRPYRPGDDPRRIDRHASARLSAAYGDDRYVIREHYAEERLALAFVVDGRPTMALHPRELGWLHKPSTVSAARAVVEASGRSVGALFRRLDELPVDLPGGGGLAFYVSDFLVLPAADVWARLLERRWEIVPVVVQDPVWEQSFPDVAGTTIPFADPASGKVRLVRLTRREVTRLRLRNEARLQAILSALERGGLEPVLLGTAEPSAVHQAFADWAARRRRPRRWAS